MSHKGLNSLSNGKIGSIRRSQDEKAADVTLEKVVRDMANVFYDLKNGISLVKSTSKRETSSYNIEDELENIYHRQAEINKKKEEEINKKAKAAKKAKVAPKKLNTNNNNNNVTSSTNNNSLRLTKKQSVPKRNSSAVRPHSEPNKSSKVVVTNLKFPMENVKEETNSKETSKNRPSTWSATATLKKPAPKSAQKRVVSVPPPREVYNPLGIIKDEVEKAIRDRKTFTIRGRFAAVRRALLNRGWVEKYHSSYRDRLNEDIKKYQLLSIEELVDLLRNKDLVETVKKMIKSKLLKNHQVDLYWDHTFDAFKECPDTKKLTLINRFRRDSFSYTSKQGLCQAAREAHWLQIPGVAKINHPRCYVLTKGGDTKTFLKDFGLTASISLLKWVVKNNITGECKVVSETGKVPLKAFDFAIAECYKFIKKQKHQDIDEEVRDALEIEWNEFLEHYYKTVHVGNHFKLLDKTVHASKEANNMVRKATYLLNLLREHLPHLDMDGYMNIWILKPTNSSRGQGIHICRTLQYILDTVRKNPNRRYVIQKYIERPLLIHDTKFDIRQWFLVSSSCPLTIWIYQHCYLRFSSQTYNLRKLHESIHLTNNSVQAKYLQRGTRDPLLPAFGMWDSRQFKSYLSDIGFQTIFEDVIYPGMKQCITGAMIAHRDKMDRRKNCFELYGADFMLTESFEPWMLEINSNPALHASTPVTAQLCPQVLEDVIKVIVDNERNPNASTGNFELIYKEKWEISIKNTNQKLEVVGTPIPEGYFCDIPTEPSIIVQVPTSKKFDTPDPGKILIQTGETMKEALKNLLEIVKREKLKRRLKRHKSTEANTDTHHSDLISIFQNSTMTNVCSDHSLKEIYFDSDEKLSEYECKKVSEALGEIKSLQNKKQVLSSLVKVVDTLKNAK